MPGSTGDSPSPACGVDASGRAWRLVPAACQAVLAAAFLLSGASKFTRPEVFLDHLTERVGLAFPIALALASILPALELVCGLCLMLNYAVREAAALLTGLLVIFIGYLLVLGGKGDCHCFIITRATSTSPWWWPIIRNLLLLGCCVPLLWRLPSSGGPSPALVSEDRKPEDVVHHVQDNDHRE